MLNTALPSSYLRYLDRHLLRAVISCNGTNHKQQHNELACSRKNLEHLDSRQFVKDMTSLGSCRSVQLSLTVSYDALL